MTVNGITRITRRGIRVIIESIFKLNSSDPTVSCVIAPRITLSLAYEWYDQMCSAASDSFY